MIGWALFEAIVKFSINMRCNDTSIWINTSIQWSTIIIDAKWKNVGKDSQSSRSLQWFEFNGGVSTLSPLKKSLRWEVNLFCETQASKVAHDFVLRSRVKTSISIFIFKIHLFFFISMPRLCHGPSTPPSLMFKQDSYSCFCCRQIHLPLPPSIGDKLHQ